MEDTANIIENGQTWNQVNKLFGVPFKTQAEKSTDKRAHIQSNRSKEIASTKW